MREDPGAGISRVDEWTVLPFPEPYRLEWENEGDEWLHHLQTKLYEIVEATGLSRTLVTPTDEPRYPPHYRITLQGSQLTSSLRVVLLDKALLLLVTGRGHDSEDQVAPWVLAIEAARERLGKTYATFEWVALIGQAAGQALQGSALAASCSVGPLRLEPGGSRMVEWVPQEMPSLFARAGFTSWPVLVKGQGEAFNWFVAGADASRQLHRLCSLLSITWGEAWTLRQAPQLASLGQLSVPAEVPAVSGPERLESSVQPAAVHSLPEWAERAWHLLEEDSTLRRAASVHHESLEMLQMHPSFALIAFVSAIETLGERLMPLERCPECKTMIGSARRFRNALSLVVIDEKVKELNVLYTSRSRTAHAGHLHGPETSFDFMSYPGMFGRDPERSFALSQVEQMKQASRELLVLALTEGLPPPTQ